MSETKTGRIGQNNKKCGKCKTALKIDASIKCSICHTELDIKCAAISAKQFQTMNKEHKQKWKCQNCMSNPKKTKKSSSILLTSATSTPINSDIKNLHNDTPNTCNNETSVTYQQPTTQFNFSPATITMRRKKNIHAKYFIGICQRRKFI